MRSELRSSLVIVAQEGNATPSRDAVPGWVAVEVVYEEDQRWSKNAGRCGCAD